MSEFEGFDDTDARGPQAGRELESRLESPLPPGVSAEEEPPEPVFLIHENRYGPGAHSVRFADGVPVGQWLAIERASLPAEAILEELLVLGLPAKHAEAFARRRAERDKSTEALAAVIGEEGAWQQFVELEQGRARKLEPLRAAFIKARKENK